MGGEGGRTSCCLSLVEKSTSPGCLRSKSWRAPRGRRRRVGGDAAEMQRRCGRGAGPRGSGAPQLAPPACEIAGDRARSRLPFGDVVRREDRAVRPVRVAELALERHPDLSALGLLHTHGRPGGVGTGLVQVLGDCGEAAALACSSSHSGAQILTSISWPNLCLTTLKPTCRKAPRHLGQSEGRGQGLREPMRAGRGLGDGRGFATWQGHGRRASEVVQRRHPPVSG